MSAFKSVFSSWQLHYYNYLIEYFVQLINYFSILRLKSYRRLEMTGPTCMAEHANSGPNNDRLREKQFGNIHIDLYVHIYTHTNTHTCTPHTHETVLTHSISAVSLTAHCFCVHLYS